MSITAPAGLPHEALAVLLQQPTVAADQQILCSLLQVCKASRAAVQRSERALTDMVISVDSRQLSAHAHALDSKHMSTLTDVGRWLSNYPGLIRTLNITCTTITVVGYQVELASPVKTILELSLRLAALGGGMQWRLESYQCDLGYLGVTPAMIAALPAATLTKLDLSAPAVTERLAEPLKGLTNLAELTICACGRADYCAPAGVVAAIGALRQLTCLSLSAGQPALLQQLPVRLQQVEVQCYYGGMVNLGHLTDLKHLDLLIEGDIDPGSVLPAQLQQLTLECNNAGPVNVLDLTSLQRLQCLTIKSPITDPLQLGSLASMSQLHELHLHEQFDSLSTGCGQMWSRLTMLRSLRLWEESSDDDVLVESCWLVASARSITSLHLQLDHCTTLDVGDHEERAGLHLCEHLKGLTQLEELDLYLRSNDYSGRGFGCLVELDLLHLTAVTRLTRLEIVAVKGLDDTAVSALATALRHLQHLSLHGGSLTTAPLPCLGLLSGLRHLDLPRYPSEVVETGLRFLTSLTQLTHLQGFGVEGPSITAFWDRIHSQQRQ